MVTMRTDWNRNKATLVKSLLENYEVRCVLLHEYASLLYPFAMPIQLLVMDDQVDRAIAILTGDFDRAADIETREAADETSAGSISHKKSLIEILGSFSCWHSTSFCLRSACCKQNTQSL
jgi:hypothetical protein